MVQWRLQKYSSCTFSNYVFCSVFIMKLFVFLVATLIYFPSVMCLKHTLHDDKEDIGMVYEDPEFARNWINPHKMVDDEDTVRDQKKTEDREMVNSDPKPTKDWIDPHKMVDDEDTGHPEKTNVKEFGGSEFTKDSSYPNEKDNETETYLDEANLEAFAVPYTVTTFILEQLEDFHVLLQYFPWQWQTVLLTIPLFFLVYILFLSSYWVDLTPVNERLQVLEDQVQELLAQQCEAIHNPDCPPEIENVGDDDNGLALEEFPHGVEEVNDQSQHLDQPVLVGQLPPVAEQIRKIEPVEHGHGMDMAWNGVNDEERQPVQASYSQPIEETEPVKDECMEII